MQGKRTTNTIVTFGALTIAGIIMAVLGLGIAESGVQSTLIAFGAALFGGALAFFLIRWS